jgi:tryptophan-rich sensory protein
MIAISLILYVKQTRQNPVYWAYAAILLHLITNFAWTKIFFGLQRPGLALIDIVLLDITLVLLIVHFWQAARLSSVLLWPYLAWVLFATYLNAGFYFLNKF